MGTFQVLPPPALAGLTYTTSATAWAFNGWIEIIQTAESCSILGLTSQWQAKPAADTTEEIVVEIGTGAAGAETTQIRVPFSFRRDTTVGYYLKTFDVFLPEPVAITAGTRLSLRIANSPALARDHSGIRLLIDRITPAGPQTFGREILQAVNRSAVT